MRVRPSADLQRRVRERAHHECEYCQIPEAVTYAPHQVDHVIGQKHGGPTTLENLALSCVLCNRYKGSDISSIDPGSGEITPLFNPRLDTWPAHFERDGEWIHGRTARGRATVRLLQFNARERRMERREWARVPDCGSTVKQPSLIAEEDEQ